MRAPTARELDARRELTPEVRERLAEYEVLARYDRRRACRYGDMANARRGRELNRRADALLAAGVPIDRQGAFPESTLPELVAAFERVARPRIRRLERETADWTAGDGAVYTRRTRYNGTSLDVWRELEYSLVTAVRDHVHGRRAEASA